VEVRTLMNIRIFKIKSYVEISFARCVTYAYVPQLFVSVHILVKQTA